GVSSPAPQVFGEGFDQTATATVTDLAGNSATATILHINVDKTAPSITASRDIAANANGWNNTNVTVSYTVGDDNSGIDAALSDHGSDQVSATSTASSNATDKADNAASASYSAQIDKAAPTITATPSVAANANGWNNTNITVSYAVGDDNSGIDAALSDYSSDLLTATGTASLNLHDTLPNLASASYSAQIDKVAPTI